MSIDKLLRVAGMFGIARPSKPKAERSAPPTPKPPTPKAPKRAQTVQHSFAHLASLRPRSRAASAVESAASWDAAFRKVSR
jgi:hypothetical protein